MHQQHPNIQFLGIPRELWLTWCHFNNLPNRRRKKKTPTVLWLAGHILRLWELPWWIKNMNKKSSCWDCWGWWVSFPKGGRFGKAIGPAVKTIPPFPIAAGCLCSGTACLNSAGLRLLQVKHFYNSHTGTQKKTKLCKWLFGILIALTGLVLRGQALNFNLHPFFSVSTMKRWKETTIGILFGHFL